MNREKETCALTCRYIKFRREELYPSGIFVRQPLILPYSLKRNNKLTLQKFTFLKFLQLKTNCILLFSRQKVLEIL